MNSSGKNSRRIADMAVVAVIYLISITGAYLFIRNGLVSNSGLPSSRQGFTAILLALTPLVSLTVFIVSIARFFKQFRLKQWGTRLKLKLIILFSVLTILTTAPPAIFLGSLTFRAIDMTSANVVRDALNEGVDMAMAYFAERDSTLGRFANNELPASLARHQLNAQKALSELSAKEPGIVALELILNGSTLAFSGDENARIVNAGYKLAESGFLGRFARGGMSWGRYFLKNAAKTAQGIPVSAILAMEYPAALETAALKISSAREVLGDSAETARSFRFYMLFASLTFVLPLIALSLLFALQATDFIIAPLRAMENAIFRVRTGDRRARLLAKKGDETGALVERFNAMLDQIERSRGDALRNEKIGVWRDIARKLAHELRNPLTPIKLSAERVLRRFTANPQNVGDILQKSMVAIIQETSNMETLLSEFHEFARLPEPQKDWVTLADLVNETVHLYSASYPSMTFSTSAIPPDMVVRVDRGYLKQALGNLVTNAADATENKGTVEFRSDLVKTAESSYCRLYIRDNGPGIPADIAEKIFSPYFTTKARGTGLGLAVVEHVVTSHGGRIRLESTEGAGTVFIIDLPADEAIQPGKALS